MRIKKQSLGVSHTNQGQKNQVSEERYVLDRTRKFHIIDVVPMGAVRMTQSDKWKTNPNHPDPKKRQREPVTKYFAFKNKVIQECNRTGYQMAGVVDVVFCIPMPDSWSEKKKARMNGMPHKSRPDIDNILKGLMDALKKEDGDIWRLKNVEKRYAYKGSIIIFE